MRYNRLALAMRTGAAVSLTPCARCGSVHAMKNLLLVVVLVAFVGCASLVARGVVSPDEAAADCATVLAICGDPSANVDPNVSAGCRIAKAFCASTETAPPTSTSTTLPTI